MVLLMRAWWIIVTLTACGRIGIDERRIASDSAPADTLADGSPADVAPDAPPDAALACPADMTRLSPSSSVCIELADRGGALWLEGKATCEALGRRYCTDAEWLEGCLNATGLVDITLDNYEWVAEEAGGIAQKRGAGGCDDGSAHVITDPYEVRCCGPML